MSNHLIFYCIKDYKMVLKYMMIIAASDDMGSLFFFPLLYMQEKEDYNSLAKLVTFLEIVVIKLLAFYQTLIYLILI